MVPELGKYAIWTSLQELNLCSNNINDKGAEALSQNSTWTNLLTLDLSLNEIGDHGAAELSKNTA